MEALNDLVKAGKVRALGASAMYGYQFYNMQLMAKEHGCLGSSGGNTTILRVSKTECPISDVCNTVTEHPPDLHTFCADSVLLIHP